MSKKDKWEGFILTPLRGIHLPKRTVKTSGSTGTPAKSSSPPTKSSKTGKNKPSGSSKASKKAGTTQWWSVSASPSPIKDDATSTTVFPPYSTLSSKPESSKTTHTSSFGLLQPSSPATTPIQKLWWKLVKPRFSIIDAIIVVVLILIIRYLAGHIVINWS